MKDLIDVFIILVVIVVYFVFIKFIHFYVIKVNNIKFTNNDTINFIIWFAWLIILFIVITDFGPSHASCMDGTNESCMELPSPGDLFVDQLTNRIITYEDPNTGNGIAVLYPRLRELIKYPNGVDPSIGAIYPNDITVKGLPGIHNTPRYSYDPTGSSSSSDSIGYPSLSSLSTISSKGNRFWSCLKRIIPCLK